MTTPNDRYAGLPKTWPDSVKETHLAIEHAHEGDLTPEQSTTLYEACNMLATAEALDAQVSADGLMLINARGAQALHPGVAEARAQRRVALAALSDARIRQAATDAPTAGAALAGARWGGRK